MYMIQKMLEKTEETIKNRQSKNTSNSGYNTTQHRKLKRLGTGPQTVVQKCRAIVVYSSFLRYAFH